MVFKVMMADKRKKIMGSLIWSNIGFAFFELWKLGLCFSSSWMSSAAWGSWCGGSEKVEVIFISIQENNVSELQFDPFQEGYLPSKSLFMWSDRIVKKNTKEVLSLFNILQTFFGLFLISRAKTVQGPNWLP